MRKSERDFMHGYDGSAHVFHEAHEECVMYLAPDKRADPYPDYHRLLLSEDYATRLGAAKAWNKWELAISKLFPDESSLELLEDDTWNLQHARMEIHYEINGGFMEDGQLLLEENVERIRGIPCSIVQGRHDMVCPAKTAWELHKALPESKLYIIPDAGHSAKEPGIQRKLIEICDEYALESFSS